MLILNNYNKDNAMENMNIIYFEEHINSTILERGYDYYIFIF